MAAYLLVIVCLGYILPLTSCLTSLSYTMREELPVNTVIGDIKADAALADDFRPEDVNRLVFSILTPVDGSDSDGNYFQIGQSTGILKVLKPLDRDAEDMCAFKKECFISFDVAIGPEEIFRVLTIRIEIEDVNDNSPVFGLNEIDLNISELAPIGSSFQLPVVYDPDSDGYGVAKMSVSPATGQFAVRWMRNSDGRVLPRLELRATLDREEVTTFDLTITASDGGSPARTAILLVHVDVLDANDNIPRFEEDKYEVRIPEDSRSGSTLIQVKAEDPDYGSNGDVTYKLGASTREQYGKLFGISDVTGEITLIGRLDRERQDVYYLSVVASDKGDDTREASATVTLFVDDINDNPPILRISTLTDNGIAHVTESSPVGTFVALLSVRDPDWGRNAEVTCSLNGGDFRLEVLQSNQFKIVTGELIDRELRHNYTIEIFCHDQGFPQKSSAVVVDVDVDDVNDNAPTFLFDDVTLHVTENIHPGSVIGQVSAADPDDDENGRVSYLTLDTYDTYTRVSEDTGVITTVRTLDREDTEQFIIYVIARDHGTPSLSSTATVTVVIDDVNDCVPRFITPVYTFVVVENDGSRRQLGQLTATDADKPPYNQIQYSLQGQDAYYLEIDPENGTLYAVKPLDRETTSVIRLQAVATDVDNPKLKGIANVTVYVSDVNDHVPSIVFPSANNNTVEISNQLKAGHVITRIQATDGDTGQNAVLEYFLTFSRKNEDKFVIDRETGIITADRDLSVVDNQLIYCTAVVKDGGIPSLVASANFTIVVNSTIGLPEALVSEQRLDMNITIVIIVIATTLVLVAILVGAIVLVFRKMSRKRDKPIYSVEKMGDLVAKNGQLDIESQQHKTDCNNDMKPVIKMLETNKCKDLDRESLGSGEGSTTDSGRGASEEGEHGDHDRSIGSRNDGNIQSPDNSSVGPNGTLGHHNATMPKRNSKNKNVTFEDDVMTNKSPSDKEDCYSPSYDSCPAISFHSPSSVGYIDLEPWSPDDNAGQYNVSAATNTPRRTVRNVKAKDRCKKLDSLTGSNGHSMIQSDPTLCTRYDRPNRVHYDFADSNSLLRYKAQGTDDSMSEITSAASTTSGSYIIDNDDSQCNC